MILTQPYVRFPAPITLNLRSEIEGEEHPPRFSTYTALPLIIHVDALARTLTAHLPPVPMRLEIYGPEDFAAACADTMDEHAERVLQCLGDDPAASLQGLINGTAPTPPPRIPREIANWRAKAILATMNLTEQVEAIIGSLPDPQRTIVTSAWAGDAKLARNGSTVLALASALGMSAQQVDELFLAAEAIEI